MAIVSSENAGKVYAQRFLKIVPKNTDIVDLNYLLFVFNGSKLIQKQVHNILEGNLIKTIKLRDVLNLNLKLPPIEAQKKIGNYYQSLKEYEILT
ncbi:MAG TPA: restriction endonuclease subunit S [Candidatus Ligilactobacillus excrementigallinarum]|uniref:Restriction endonuclease subunit S n=1 Tax=Candidatus Ligilactobacillus excrementigallinarum TaxID=2838641 RepID=A0A9D1UXR2_9LACO|nr:restriction endonuclease subunit S [Candidatus Ligilactobacillus excrementigallinarum]